MGEASSSIELASFTRSTSQYSHSDDARYTNIPKEVEVPIPPQPSTDTPWDACLQRAEIRRMLKVLAAIMTVLLSLNVFLVIITTRDIHECGISFTVSKYGEADFRTVSDAIDACPADYYQFKYVCVSIREGQYLERVRIGADKTNLILIEKTIITSNASSDAVLPAPTLWPGRGKRLHGTRSVHHQHRQVWRCR